MSPSSLCAWSVIPTVPTPPSTETHSCSLVYRKFSGYMLFRSFVERSFHCHRIHGLVADHDLNGLARDRVLHGQVTQADILVERRRGSAARHPSRRYAVQEDLVSVPSDAAAAHLESHQLAANAVFLLLEQHVAPDKLTLIELHDPAQVGLQRRNRGVDLVPVERHLGFQAQRIARA